MRSFAIYQVIITLATLALFTLPHGTQALPVRGALGSLNTRARVARRAAVHAQNGPALEKRFKTATSKDTTALPANPKQQILSKVRIAEDVKESPLDGTTNQNLQLKRDTGLVVDAAPSSAPSPASSSSIAPGSKAMVLALVRPSAVVRQNIVAPVAILAVEDPSSASDDTVTSSGVSNPQDSSSSGDAEAIYQSYVHQLSDSIPAAAPATSTVVDVAPTGLQIAAIIPAQSAPSAAIPDAQAIYNSYVAQMNAPAAPSSS